MPEVAKEWDRRLDEAFAAAAQEANVKGNPELAEALTELRLYMGHWREIAQSRLRDLGVYALSRTEHEIVVKIVADAVAKETVQEARRQVEHQHNAWWQSRAVKWGVIMAAASLVSSVVLGAINVFLSSHP